MKPLASDPYLPTPATIIARRQESPTIFSIDARFQEDSQQGNFNFRPGQFNMLYLYGVGEVAISISSDPQNTSFLTHTIRAVGRVTRAMQALNEGDTIGIRGPYGNGWPMKEAEGKNVIVVTGGLGCAPTLSVINYIMTRRERYGSVKILQGVKHSDDLIFRSHYAQWQKTRDTEVLIAADKAGPHWPWVTGFVTDMIQDISLDPKHSIAMLCGPEAMMLAGIKALTKRGMREPDVYLSMERNMECGFGHCGHCQYGGLFICKDGPVFAYPQVKELFLVKGF